MTRDAQLAAQVEKVVLNFDQRLAHLGGQLLGEQHPERGIQLVDLAEGGDARVVLRHARAVAEAGLAGVAGARGDLREAVAHQRFFTSLSMRPCAKAVVMRSPSRTARAL